MRQPFKTKQDFKTNDIIVLRTGDLGVVILETEIVLYQKGGFDYLDEFTDDLRSADGETAFDIMEVYRNRAGGPLGFIDYVDDDPIFEREEGFVPVSPKASPKPVFSQPTQEEQPEKKEYIDVIAQAFYGNRMATSFRLDRIDALVLGHLNDSLPIREPIDRTIVRIPDTDSLVLVYNRFQEEEALNRKPRSEDRPYKMKPLAVIPELNLTLYSRCIACRINEDGKLESVKPEDCSILWKYLAE